MNTPLEPEDFKQLRRLLGLKRYEQPPPGYFSGFSRQVIGRIQRGERLQRVSLLERLQWEAPWLQRLWNAFEARPILAGAFGVTVCGLLAGGLLYSYQPEPASGDSLAGAPPDPASLAFGVNPSPSALSAARSGPWSPATSVSNATLSESLFDQVRPVPQNASFTPGL
jgi:hypothetical protein